MLPLVADPHAWASLATLTALEIVLGVDNILFLSIAIAPLAPARRTSARRIGLSLALVMRIALLTGIVWIVSLSKPVVTVWGLALSWRDLIFAAGGLFRPARQSAAVDIGDQFAEPLDARALKHRLHHPMLALPDLAFADDDAVADQDPDAIQTHSEPRTDSKQW